MFFIHKFKKDDIIKDKKNFYKKITQLSFNEI